jgi:hypothetical protein
MNGEGRGSQKIAKIAENAKIGELKIGGDDFASFPFGA